MLFHSLRTSEEEIWKLNSNVGADFKEAQQVQTQDCARVLSCPHFFTLCWEKWEVGVAVYWNMERWLKSTQLQGKTELVQTNTSQWPLPLFSTAWTLLPKPSVVLSCLVVSLVAFSRPQGWFPRLLERHWRVLLYLPLVLSRWSHSTQFMLKSRRD